VQGVAGIMVPESSAAGIGSGMRLKCIKQQLFQCCHFHPRIFFRFLTILRDSPFISPTTRYVLLQKVTRLRGAVAVGGRASVGTVEPLVKGLRRALVISFQELTDLQTLKKSLLAHLCSHVFNSFKYC
jgi:hypothetical protein